jgi:Domain of unknown function (DUF4184)
MPFTLAHPIAIAPIWYAYRRHLDLASLCIGAIMPDLDLFIPIIPEGGHTLRGIFTIDLPCAILFLLVIRWVIAKPFIALLPPYLGSCLPQPRMPPIVTAIVSIVIGSLTHIIWDAFTHHDGWFVRHYDFLRVPTGRWPLYELLQHGCGVAGLIATALWIAWAFAQAQPQQRPDTLSLAYRFAIITLIVIVTIMATLLDIRAGIKVGQPREGLAVRGVVGAITGIGGGFLVYAIGFWLHQLSIKKYWG